MTRLTTNPANDMQGLWMPNNREIVFSSDRGGGVDLGFFRKSAVIPDGEVKLALNRPAGQFDLHDISADGRWAALSDHTPPNQTISLVLLDGSSAPVLFSSTRGPDYLPRFSPNGKWLSYGSSVSGRGEIYARRFNSVTGAPEGNAIQVSGGGGDFPSWSRDGKELFFLGPDNRIYFVPLTQIEGSGPVPTPLFRICPGTSPISGAYAGYPYEPSPDRRFLCICTTDQNSILEFNVMSGRGSER
jgi:Tol biopolymer transport system component